MAKTLREIKTDEFKKKIEEEKLRKDKEDELKKQKTADFKKQIQTEKDIQKELEQVKQEGPFFAGGARAEAERRVASGPDSITIDESKPQATLVDGNIVGGGFADLSQEDKQKYKLQEAKRLEDKAKAEAEILKEQEEIAKESDLEETIRRRKEEIAQSERESKEQLKRTESGIKSISSIKRGGIGGELEVPIIEGIERASIRQQRKFDELKQSLLSAERGLEVARKGKDIEERARALTAQRVAIEALQDLEDEIKEGASTEADKALSFFDKLSAASIAALSDEDIEKLEEDFETAGRPISALSAIVSKSKQLADINEKLLKNPTDEDLLNKKRVLEGKIDKINVEATQTDVEKAIEGVQALNDAVISGQITQEAADAISRKLGFKEDVETIKVGEDVYEYNPATGKTNKIVDNSGNNVLIPTGQLTTQTVNGLKYTLDSAAMVAFQDANQSAITAGIGPIKTQSTRTASHRDHATQLGLYGQGRTIDQLITSGFTKEEAELYSRPDLPIVTNAKVSDHESGLAIDIQADKDYIETVRPFLESQGYKQTALSIGDFGHFEFQGRTKPVEDDIKKTAQDIFTGSSDLRLSDISIKDNRREKVSNELTRLKNKALEQSKTEESPSDAIKGAMRASAGGKATDATFNSSFEKLATTINQVSTLNDAMNKKKITGEDASGNNVDLAPLTGWIKSKNPWSQEGQTINAILQGTIPNLARGVFGEVGVLTDRDVELYRKTLPNLTQPDDIKKSVTAITMRTLRNSLDNKIRIGAGTGRDLSGLIGFYEDMDNKVKQLEKELGINAEEKLVETPLQRLERIKIERQKEENKSENDSIREEIANEQ